jgi:O-antigen/teichoic acid export membrane protein
LRLAFPVLLLPLMAARLGADEFGRLSLFLVWAGLLSTVVEGGFLAAATRLAVRASAAGRRALASQVLSARVALSGAAALASIVVVAGLMPEAGLAEQAVAAGLLALLACALGWQATWYLQASEQLHRWAWVEMAVYALWALAVVFGAQSVAAYLWMQALATGGLAAAGWWWLRRDLPGPEPLWSAAEVRPGLRLGWTMMPVSVAGAAYSFALPAVASAQLSRSDLGLYFLADRLVRALLAAADPLFQLIYPRIVNRFGQGTRAALRYSARWALLGAAAGLLMMGLGWLGWPWLSGWLSAARGGLDTVRLQPILSTLAWLLPLLLGWKFFGYWMLGSGRFDAAYRACMIVGGAAGVAAAWAWGAGGAEVLARVAVAIEGLVMISAVFGIALTLKREKHRPQLR